MTLKTMAVYFAKNHALRGVRIVTYRYGIARKQGKNYSERTAN